MIAKERNNVSAACLTVSDLIKLLQTFQSNALVSFDGSINYVSVGLTPKQDGEYQIVDIVPSMWCRK
jgi:hypothetical protein